MSTRDPRVVRGAIPVTRLVSHRVEIPAAAAPAGGHPWALFLHGMGQSGAEFARIASGCAHEALARVFPDGTFEFEARGESGERRRAHAWYVYTGPGDDFTRALATAEGHLARLVRRLLAEHPLDPRRGALVGYSQGAYLAGFAAFRNRALFPRGVALASGRLKDEILASEIASAPDYPVLLVHGAKDRAVPFEFAEKGMSALERSGHRASRLVAAPGGHAFSPEMQRAVLDFLVSTLGLGA